MLELLNPFIIELLTYATTFFFFIALTIVYYKYAKLKTGLFELKEEMKHKSMTCTCDPELWDLFIIGTRKLLNQHNVRLIKELEPSDAD